LFCSVKVTFICNCQVIVSAVLGHLHGAAMTHALRSHFMVKTQTYICRKPPFSWIQRMSDRLRNGLLNPSNLVKAQKLPVQASMACLLPNSGKETLSQDCFSSAAGLLQDALRAKLGLPQPRLLELMQACQQLFSLHV